MAKKTYRCKECNRLLFKGTVRKGYISIKCPRCGTFNLIDKSSLT